MLSEKTWAAKWDHLPEHQQILLTGDGSALFAMQYRREKPQASDWQVIAAVQGYRRLIGDRVINNLTIMPEVCLASAYRAAHLGCSFAEVADAVAARRGAGQ
jgi:hypothetical protein